MYAAETGTHTYTRMHTTLISLMNVIKTYDVVQKKLKYSNIVKDRAECHKASTLSNSVLGGTGIKHLFLRISMPRETTVYIF